ATCLRRHRSRPCKGPCTALAIRGRHAHCPAPFNIIAEIPCNPWHNPALRRAYMRSIWKGHIRFLLVAIPVRIYNAIETSEKIQFNQLHRDDFGPIGYDKRCKKCNEVVTNDQITKGYQYEPDRYAIVEPDDISKIKIKTTKAVDIVGFVDREEIPSTFY